jgi:hypothetical protein
MYNLAASIAINTVQIKIKIYADYLFNFADFAC